MSANCPLGRVAQLPREYLARVLILVVADCPLGQEGQILTVAEIEVIVLILVVADCPLGQKFKKRFGSDGRVLILVVADCPLGQHFCKVLIFRLLSTNI
jgi:hypothetical protein